MGKLDKLKGSWWLPITTSGTAKDNVRIIDAGTDDGKIVIQDSAGSSIMRSHNFWSSQGTFDTAMVVASIASARRTAVATLEKRLLPIFLSLPEAPPMTTALVDRILNHPDYVNQQFYDSRCIDPRVVYLIASATHTASNAQSPRLAYLTDREPVGSQWRHRVYSIMYLSTNVAASVMDIAHEVRAEMEQRANIRYARIT